MTFTERIKVELAESYTTGTAERFGEVIDARGYDGLTFVMHVHDVGASYTGGLILQASDTEAVETFASTSAVLTVGAADVGAIKVIDVTGPTHSFYRLRLLNSSGQTIATSATAFLWHGKRQPVSVSTWADIERFHAV